MAIDSLSLPLVAARRLAIQAQGLSGPIPHRVTSEAIVDLLRQVGYVQWDPVRIVAPSHLLSLWARLGPFDPKLLETLLWKSKRLFEHWTPIASLVLMEDFAIYHALMRRYPDSMGRSWGTQGTSAARFLRAHRPLRESVLRELGRGPRRTDEFPVPARRRTPADGWFQGSDLAQMLFHLLMAGEVMVVGHSGGKNLWGLAAPFLPKSADHSEITDEEGARRAARRAVHALGTATPREINLYFVRGRYRDPTATLRQLERDGEMQRVSLVGGSTREERYMRTDDVGRARRLTEHEDLPRVSLLPPFDNLLFSQARGRSLFGFEYVREQFLPKAKRRFGLYVLPILDGAELVGRLDARTELEQGELRVLSVHAEDAYRNDRSRGPRIREAIDRLARSVGVERVRFEGPVPRAWRPSLR